MKPRPLHPLTTMAPDRLLIAPSLLAADFSRLGDEIQRVERAGADLLHIDIMDGHFVPNLSMGPPVVEAIRRVTELPFDVHLMLTNPANFVDAFIAAGADHITIHVESNDDPAEVLERIHAAGCSAGVSLRPATPADAIAPYLPNLDLVLVMTVEPGFGGQPFRYDMLPKITRVAELVKQSGRPCHVEVDGGVNMQTAPAAVKAGANMLVAGTSIFRAPDSAERAIETLRSTPSD